MQKYCGRNASLRREFQKHIVRMVGRREDIFLILRLHEAKTIRPPSDERTGKGKRKGLSPELPAFAHGRSPFIGGKCHFLSDGLNGVVIVAERVDEKESGQSDENRKTCAEKDFLDTFHL